MNKSLVSRSLARTQLRSSLALALLFCLVSILATAQSPEKKVERSVSYVETPLAFEPAADKGAAGELYSAVGHGYSVGLRKDGAVVSFPGAGDKAVGRQFSLLMVGSNPGAVSAEDVRPGVANYIPSSDTKSWRMGVQRWERVNYSAVYPGIDLSFYGNKQLLEYDFRVKPHADAERIQMSLSGVDAARLDAEGDLELQIAGASIRLLKPQTYQLSNIGIREAVNSAYSLVADEGNKKWRLGFKIGAYDTSRELIIDPVLSYGQILIESDYTVGAVAVDSTGNTYVTGQGQTKGFYVNKYNSSGTLVYSTIVGSGTATCYPTGIAIDSVGGAYVVGSAVPGLPTTANAYQATSPASKSYFNVPFVAVLPASGAAPTYLSYLGGTNNDDYSSGIAVDSANHIYITGYETSTNFPVTTGAYLATYPGGYAAFSAKLDPTKSGTASLVYSTLLGAANINSYGTGIAVDGTGNAYVSIISTLGYPVTSGAFNYEGTFAAGSQYDAFVTKVNPGGTALLYSAFLGPGESNAIAVDASGDAYVTGNVYGDDFPTTSGAYQTAYPGGFVSELNPAGAALLYSTFLSGPSGAFSPGSNTVFPQSIAITPGCSSSCAAYVAGYTTATDFPGVNAIENIPPPNQGANAFIAEIAGNGASATLSSYLAGSVTTVTSPFSSPLFPTPAAAVDGSGNIYFVANVQGTDFPTTIALPKTDGYSYLAKIAPAASGFIVPYPTSVDFDNYNTSGEAIGVSSTLFGTPVPLVLRNLGSAPVAISSITFTPATQFSETDNCSLTIPAGGSCTLNLVFTPTAKGLQTATLSVASNAAVSPVSLPISGTGEAYGYLQTSAAALTFADTALGSSTASQTITVSNIGQTLVNLQPFTLSSVRASYGNGSDFQLLSNCPAQLLPAASCTVGVTFTPLATGARAATFYLQGDGFGNQTISLYGAGVSGADIGVALTATVLNFNAQLVNTPAPRQTITLTGTGTAPVSIYSITIATKGQTGTSDFSIFSGNCSSTSLVVVSPQATCSLNIEYTPTIVGAETGTLTIVDSAVGSPHVVALNGSGLAAAQSLEFTPGNFAFPDQPIGVPTSATTFYVYNTGTAPVTVDRLLVTGDFSVYSSNCPGALLKPGPAAGVGYNFNYNCTVRVQFTPTATGARTGTLTFVDSAGGNPQVLTLAGNGITATGGIFLEPSSLVFPVQAVGTTSVMQRLTISNPGNSPVSLNNISSTGDYAIVDSCASGTYPYVLGPQRTCAVDISFTPTGTTNPNTGSFVVASSAGNATLPITGSGEAATIAIGLTPTAVSFGNVVDATQSSAYNIYVRNTGTEAVTLTSGTVTGTNAADFAFSSGSCGFYGNLLAPGASCYVQVYLTPSAAGARSALLSLVDSAGTQTVALTGTGVAALSGVQPAPVGLAFDQVPVGNVSASNQYAYLYNHGTTSVTVSTAKISAGGSSFLIPVGADSCTGATITANSQCNVQVQFSPSAAGYQTGTLTFTDSTSKTYTVTLAGYAPTVSVSAYLDPSALAFPGQVLTTYSNTQTVSLYNTSDLPMTVGTLTGTNAIVGTATTGAFSTSGTQGGYDGCSGQVVAVRAKCQVSIAFAPTVAGSATGSLVFPVTYGNSTTASFTLSLSGTGIAVKDVAELSPAAIIFQDEAVAAQTNNGADATQVINLWNTGNLPLTVGTLTGVDTVIGTSATGDFTTSSTFSGSDGCTNQVVSNGSYCSVTVAFNPAAAGAKSGNISFPVTYSDKTTATLTAALSGKGIAGASKVVVSPSSGQFGVQVVGTTSDSSETLTFNMLNSGNLPVKISTATITSPFSFVSDGCSGTTLTINYSCSITVAFSPTKTGAATGTLSIPDTAAGSPQAIVLTGTGILATQQIVLSQTSIAFGNQVVATKSAPVTVLVSNQSGASVPVSSVVLSGANAADFVESDNCAGGSISGHNNCSITVTFFPATASLGARSATITEADTAGGSPRTITLTGTGIAAGPAVALYPASLNFGSQALSTDSTPLSFSVNNTGTAPLTISNVVSSNATEFPLTSDACIHQTIAVGANCLISVRFDPNAGSTQTSTITITDNATVTTQTLTATGLSVGVPQAKLTPTSLTFASQGVGTASAAQTITLSDPGTDTLNIASIAFTGTNATDFHQTNTCGTAIVASASCTITVTFDPVAVGSRSASLSITDNAGNTAGTIQTAALAGTGTGVAKIAFSPTSLTFPSTNVGASSAVQTVTVGNPGTAPLAIASIGVTPTGDYTQTNTCGTSLAAGAQCVVSVTFSPSAAGTRTASISVADGATGSPQTVALSGTGVGVATASLSASTIAFGSQAVGVVSAAQPITLTNTGSGSLIVASLKIAGTNYGDFAETSTTCPGTLAPAASCTINVTFKPAAATARSGTLTITDNTGNVTGSTQVVTLTGTGAGTPQVKFSATTLTFASDPVGQAEGTQSLVMGNPGNGPLQIASIVLSGADPKDFLEFDTCQPSVAANATCEIALYFIPTAAGTRTANVVVTDNANNVAGATQTISVTGTATGAPLATLSLTTMSFGSVAVATQSSGQSVTLTNTGNSPLTVSSVALAGTDPGDYSVFNTCSSVSEGSTCIAVVFFKPTTTGSRPATLVFTDNANNVAGTTQTVTLSGTGGTSNVASVSLSPGSLTFASTAVGSQTAAQAFTLTNTGSSTVSIATGGITYTGANASSFVQTGTTCTTTLAAGASCTIMVAFKPTAAGSLVGGISIADNAAGSPQTAALSGTGTAAGGGGTLTVSPATLTFASTTVGSQSAAQQVILKNTGTVVVNFPTGAFSYTGANASSFVQTGINCGTTLAVGASCAVAIAFKPTAAGTMSGSLSIADDASGSPQLVSLTGTGTASGGGDTLTFNVTSLTFAATAVGSQTAAQQIVVKNTGSTAVTFPTGAFAYTGADPSSFVQTRINCGSSLAAGAACAVAIAFKPAATGALTASLSITDSATGSPQTIGLSGTGN